MEALLRGTGKLTRRIGGANLAAIACLAVALGSLVYGASAAMPGLDAGPLLALALAGVLFGWLLAGTKLPGWIAGLVFLSLGILIATLGIGRLARPLARLAGAEVDWVWQVLRPERFRQEPIAVPDHTSLEQAWQGLVQAGQTLVERSSAWVTALYNGSPAYDPLAVLLVWALLVWLVATWAAWWTRARGQPLIGLLPSGFLLAAGVAYSGEAVYPAAIWLGSAICLQALSTYLKRSNLWRAGHFDVADIQFEWAFGVLVIAALLVGAALAIPSISLEKLADRLQQAFSAGEDTSTDVARALGLQVNARDGRTPLELAQNAGLPNEHLLGSGAELSERVVMWVALAGAIPMPSQLIASQPDLAPPTYYWRGLTYDRYTGRGWSTTPRSLEVFPADYSLAERLVSFESAPFITIRQTIQKANEGGGLLFASGELLQASEVFQVAWRSPGDIFGAQVGEAEYTVDSRLALPTPEQLRATGQNYPDWVRETYLPLPESVPRRVWELALDLTAAEATPYDQALAIESYLRTFYTYTLDLEPPPAQRDLVDYFLFDLRRGYCDYYASAMAVLARAAGLPARVVVGYASGAYIPEEARFAVTEADAHAWTEIYFPGYGWVEFEPTAGRPALERPGMEEHLVSQVLPVSPTEPPEEPAQPEVLNLRQVIFIALGVALFLLVAWQVGDRARLRWMPAGWAVTALYRRMYQRGSALLGNSPPGSTPVEFSAQLRRRLAVGAKHPADVEPAYATSRPDDSPIQVLAELYAREIYSSHPAGENERAGALRSWRRLRGGLWRARVKNLFSRKKATGG